MAFQNRWRCRCVSGVAGCAPTGIDAFARLRIQATSFFFLIQDLITFRCRLAPISNPGIRPSRRIYSHRKSSGGRSARIATLIKKKTPVRESHSKREGGGIEKRFDAEESVRSAARRRDETAEFVEEQIRPMKIGDDVFHQRSSELIKWRPGEMMAAAERDEILRRTFPSTYAKLIT